MSNVTDEAVKIVRNPAGDIIVTGTAASVFSFARIFPSNLAANLLKICARAGEGWKPTLASAQRMFPNTCKSPPCLHYVAQGCKIGQLHRCQSRRTGRTSPRLVSPAA